MEDIINKIDGQVQIIFEKGSGHQTYRDALWMSQEEYDDTTSETIEAMKQQRYDNWIALVTGLPTEEPASVEPDVTVEQSDTSDTTSTETSDSAPTTDTTDSQPTDPV